jgi:hypothetical protein
MVASLTARLRSRKLGEDGITGPGVRFDLA